MYATWTLTLCGFGWLGIVLLPTLLSAQADTLPAPLLPESSQQALEDVLQEIEGEGDFDFNTLYEHLTVYLRQPLLLNDAGEAELHDFGLLTAVQIVNLLAYRELAGPLISIYELQAVPGFDLRTIRAILPYVAIQGDTDDYQATLPQMLSQGKNELYLRWSRILEAQRGYQLPADGSAASYLGDPNQVYLRFRHTYSNRLSYGLTAEKDRGEEFFRGSNPQGFDFYSAHFYLRDYTRRLRAVALGDYNISLGQGLILHSGYSGGKSVLATSVKRGGRVVRPYSSASEAQFMRGAALTLDLGEHWSVTAFTSHRKRDANRIEPDTTAGGLSGLRFSSLSISGLHRTPAEINDRRAVRQLSLGGSLKYRTAAGHLAINSLWERFNGELVRRVQPYNQFYFSGDRTANVSIDYAYRHRNLHFFGETAIDHDGTVATVDGLLAGLNPRVDLALVFRHYPRDYVALNASPFAETSGGRNESGLYLGLVVRPARGWQLGGYFDLWRHPWLRFNADAPSGGHEYRLRLTHFRKRTYEIYLEVRDEVKDKNSSLDGTKTSWPAPARIFQARLHLAYHLFRALEWRSRIDVGFAENESHELQRGFVVYQDLLFRPIGFPLSFTTRFALMDTDGFAIRFYAYENGLLYAFSIPPYYNRGSRFYFNLRYKGIRGLTIEGRFAQTYWWNEDHFGSGPEQIDGPTKTQLGVQLKYMF